MPRDAGNSNPILKTNSSLASTAARSQQMPTQSLGSNEKISTNHTIKTLWFHQCLTWQPSHHLSSYKPIKWALTLLFNSFLFLSQKDFFQFDSLLFRFISSRYELVKEIHDHWLAFKSEFVTSRRLNLSIKINQGERLLQCPASQQKCVSYSSIMALFSEISAVKIKLGRSEIFIW